MFEAVIPQEQVQTDHKKQPAVLYVISAANLWERFGYYTTRGILVLYMIKTLLFSHEKAYAIFAAFTGLFYLAPLLGGYLADKVLGAKNSVILGGLLLALGYFLLAIPGVQFFYFALAIVIVGSGLFMPNISSVLGQVYEDNDPRREGGFSILYAAINIGAFVPPLISAGVITLFGWHSAFFVAGIGTVIGVAIFYFFIYRKSDLQIMKKMSCLLIFVGIMCGALLIEILLKNTKIANSVLFSLGGFLILITLKAAFDYSAQARNRLLACLLLTGFSILFCVLCEQAAMSLTIYTEYNVNRNWHEFIIPTVAFLALNPFFIITCSPLASKLWIWLDAKKLNPSIPVKFAIGTILAGISFIILPIGMYLQSSAGQISLWWIVLKHNIKIIFGL